MQPLNIVNCLAAARPAISKPITHPNIVNCLAAARPAIPAPITAIVGLRCGVIISRSGFTVRGRIPVLTIPR